MRFLEEYERKRHLFVYKFGLFHFGADHIKGGIGQIMVSESREQNFPTGNCWQDDTQCCGADCRHSSGSGSDRYSDGGERHLGIEGRGHDESDPVCVRPDHPVF